MKVGFEDEPGEVDKVRAPSRESNSLAGVAPREIGLEAMMVESRLRDGGRR